MWLFLSGWQGNANDEIVGNFAEVGRSIVGNILNVIRLVGSGLAIIMLTYMSISYYIWIYS